jgi:serine/threonine protein kinase
LHGDLKPENLIVSPIGHVTICDLGFARKVAGENTDVIDPTMILATPKYAAPELYCSSLHRSSMEQGFASDVYSLGVVLFELLTGSHPLGELANEEYIAAHREVQSLDPRHFDPLITREIRYLLMQMLAKEPLRRPTVERLVERLIDLEIATFDDRAIAC